MPKFLFRASYTASGAGGLLKDGGTKRRAVVEELARSLGGSVESVYWAFGDDDFVCIAEMPDSHAAAALSLTVGASGAVRLTTTHLLSAEDVDDVIGRRAIYTPPGG